MVPGYVKPYVSARMGRTCDFAASFRQGPEMAQLVRFDGHLEWRYFTPSQSLAVADGVLTLVRLLCSCAAFRLQPLESRLSLDDTPLSSLDLSNEQGRVVGGALVVETVFRGLQGTLRLSQRLARLRKIEIVNHGDDYWRRLTYRQSPDRRGQHRRRSADPPVCCFAAKTSLSFDMHSVGATGRLPGPGSFRSAISSAAAR